MWRKSATSPFVLAAQLMCTLYCLIYTHPQTINQKAFELTRTTYFTKGCIVRLGAGERGVHSPLSESIPVKSYRDCDWIWKRTSASINKTERLRHLFICIIDLIVLILIY